MNQPTIPKADWWARLLLPALAVIALAFALGSLPSDRLMTEDPSVEADTRADPSIAFATDLVATLPEPLPAARLAAELAQRREQSPTASGPGLSWGFFIRLLKNAFYTYAVCLSAMVLSGFLVFLAFQSQVLPGNPRSKVWRLFLTLLGFGVPAVVWALGIVAFYAWRVPNFWVEPSFWVAEGIILFCLVFGDGLTGMFLLGTRALVSGSEFEGRFVAEWASLRIKGSLLPFPGTMSAVIAREVRRRASSEWIGLLGRFLLAEITLEFVLRTVNLQPRGLGIFVFETMTSSLPPTALAITAFVSLLPILVLSGSGSGDRHLGVTAIDDV